jgi:uncharacterized protein YbjQ (UPF0145 family)
MKSINFTFLMAFVFFTSLFFDVEVRAFDPGEGPCPSGYKKIFLRETGIRRIYDCISTGSTPTQADVRKIDQEKSTSEPKQFQSSKGSGSASQPRRRGADQANQKRGNDKDQDIKDNKTQASEDNGDKPQEGIDMDCGEREMVCPEDMTPCFCRPNNDSNNESPTEEKANPAAAQCMSEFGRLVQECNKEADNAMTSCNDENEAMQAAANAAKSIGAGAVVSIQVACSKINDISKLANEAFAGWQSLCSANQGGCQENCKKAREILNSDCMDSATKEEMRSEHQSKINKNIVQCESYKQKLFDAAQHAVAAIAQTKASEQCKKDTSADLNKNAILDQCKINPNTPMCTDMQKCSNPAFAAQNPVCSCVSNPTSPACLQANASYGNKGLSMGATIPGVKNDKGENLPGMNPNGNAEANPFPGFNNGGGQSDGASVGGRQGDAGSAGSGKMGADNGAGNGKGGYGSGNEKDGIKVNSGTYGGGGSGYFGPNYGGAGGGALGGANNPTGARRDIAKFDPRKYIVGQGGQGEYLNGPNGNIFKIMKLRYEENRSTFLPETFVLKK